MSSLLRVGRLRLAASPGRSPVVHVHEIGASRSHRCRSGPAGARAFCYVQRGHAGSDWAAGHAYYTTDFVLDLLRYLRTVFEEPVVLEGEGVGGLVAALTAAAEPTAVAGLSLLPVPAVDPRGWSERPELVVSSLSQLNHGWVHAARRWSDVLHDPSANDPVLSAGPPCSLRAEAVREALRNLTAPWWCPEPHFAAALLPASLRIDQPPSALDLGRKQT